MHREILMLDLSSHRLETVDISESRPISTFAVKRGKVVVACGDGPRVSIFDAASGQLVAKVDLGLEVEGLIKVCCSICQYVCVDGQWYN